MTEIMLIRRFDAPIGADYLHQATVALAWCPEPVRRHAGTAFHRTRRPALRLHFRRTGRRGGAQRDPRRQALRARGRVGLHRPSGADDDGRRDPSHTTRALVLVERRFDEPVAFEEILAIGERNIACFESHDARFVRSYFSTTGAA
jgi:hypothetical protein